MNDFHAAMGTPGESPKDEAPPVFASEFADVAEAEVEPVNTGAGKKKTRRSRRERPFAGGPSRRRQAIIGFIVLVVIVLVVAIATSKPKSTPTVTTPTASVPSKVVPAKPVKKKTTPVKKSTLAAKPKKSSLAAKPITGSQSSTTSTSTDNTNTGIKIGSPINRSALGLPTAKETAEAKFALLQGKDMLELNQNVGALIATPQALECLIWDHSRYAIQVVGGSPRPFIGTKRGQISIADGHEVGFILIYVTAGRVGLPYIADVHLRKSNYRYSDSARSCTLPPAGQAQLNAPAPS